MVNLNSFNADFIQTITDDNGKVLSYNGHIKASKPQFALWNYTKPIKKDIYISRKKVVIIEPEIEQVIIRRINISFNFFKMIQNAKKLDKNTYTTIFENSKYIIKIKKSKIKSISYKDEFENSVKIIFKNQIQNAVIPQTIYLPNIPKGYDVIRD